MNIKKWLLKKKLHKAGYEWVDISSMALIDYRYRVKNNKDEDSFTLEKKLNRNWQMATFEKEEGNLIHKNFGALKIIYDKSKNMIVGITNHKGNGYQQDIDKNMKNNLNKLYSL